MRKRTATIEVNCRKKIGDLSPLLYGGGFENVGGSVHLGLDAQMLEGENFQEEDVNEDGVSDKWWPVGDGSNAVRYGRDGRRFRSGSYSQKIDILRYRDGQRGIGQGGLFVQKGKRYVASLCLCQKGWSSGTTVAASLRKGRRVLAQREISRVTPDWQNHTFVLEPDRSHADVEFAILMKGEGILWIDRVSLVPEETYLGHGTRKDIVEAICSLRPAFIRWPGGWFSEDYHWKDGVAFPDHRPVRLKHYSSIKARSDPSWESNRFGTDEFIRFCRDISAVPMLTVNIGYGNRGEDLDERIDEACSWVEYCNGNETTLYGALRKGNGSPEPYGVEYWCIGNEPWEMDAAEYGKRCEKFARKMKEKDARIKVIAAGGYGYNAEWNENVLNIAGSSIDFLDLHYYYSGDYLDAMAEPLMYERFLKTLRRRISAVQGKKEVKIAILEWNSNTNLKEAGGLKEGLFAAGFLNVIERQSDFLALASPWPLLRRAPTSGDPLSDHGLIRYDRKNVYYSPTALAFKLYRDHFGLERIACSVNGPQFRTAKKVTLPCLDAVASRGGREDFILLKIVNKSHDREIPARVVIKGLTNKELTATISTLNGMSPESNNDVNHPNNVRITCTEALWNSDYAEYTFPPHSVTAIKLYLHQSISKGLKR